MKEAIDMKDVVVTGMGAITPLGAGVGALFRTAA